GLRRAHVIRSLATRYKTRDRAFLEAKLWEQEGKGVRGALCFDEAAFWVARDKKISFSEASARAPEIAAEVARRRRDLVTDYKAGRDEPPPPRKPRPDDDDEAVRLKQAEQWCRETDQPLTEANVYRAKVALARLHGGPKY